MIGEVIITDRAAEQIRVPLSSALEKQRRGEKQLERYESGH